MPALLGRANIHHRCSSWVVSFGLNRPRKMFLAYVLRLSGRFTSLSIQHRDRGDDTKQTVSTARTDLSQKHGEPGTEESINVRASGGERLLRATG